jgi:hypothetical protein
MERKRQRYFCLKCLNSFSLTSKFTYSKKLINKIFKEYFETKSSYRDLSRKYDTNKKRINDWVKSSSKNFKTTIDIARELKPVWSGYLTVDGKIIKYQGKKGCMYIGVDNCGDIVHISAGDGFENKSSWNIFFKELKGEIDYPLIVLISDGNPDISATCLNYYQYFIYQSCAYHFLKRIDRTFGYLTVIRSKVKRKQFSLEIEMRHKIHRLIHQKDLNSFVLSYNNIVHIFFEKYYHSQYCRSMLDTLKNNLGYLTPHYFDSNIPRTSNLAETTIKQYQRRLKNIEGFQSFAGLRDYLNVFTMFLRSKKYTDCRNINKHKNGKSRLQMAGVNTDKLDWFLYGCGK